MLSFRFLFRRIPDLWIWTYPPTTAVLLNNDLIFIEWKHIAVPLPCGLVDCDTPYEYTQPYRAFVHTSCCGGIWKLHVSLEKKQNKFWSVIHSESYDIVGEFIILDVPLCPYKDKCNQNILSPTSITHESFVNEMTLIGLDLTPSPFLINPCNDEPSFSCSGREPGSYVVLSIDFLSVLNLSDFAFKYAPAGVPSGALDNAMIASILSHYSSKLLPGFTISYVP